MIRVMEDNDCPGLAAMLKAEGLGEQDMDFKKAATWVMDEDGPKGFFSVRMEHYMPYLVHFVIKQGERSPARFFRMLRGFKNVVRSFGYKKAIVNTMKHDDYTSSIASKRFRATPYGDDEHLKYYLVEV